MSTMNTLLSVVVIFSRRFDSNATGRTCWPYNVDVSVSSRRRRLDHGVVGRVMGASEIACEKVADQAFENECEEREARDELTADRQCRE